MKSYRDEAIVLRTHKLGEADRIITLLTAEHGQVRAVAKGVRKTTSKFGARVEPFSVIDAQLHRGRTLDTLTQVASIAQYGDAIAANYDLYLAATVVVETAERLTADAHDGSHSQYLLLLGALNALARRRHDPTLIRSSYTLRALALAGWAPPARLRRVRSTRTPLLLLHPRRGHRMRHLPPARRLLARARQRCPPRPAPQRRLGARRPMRGLRANRGLGPYLLLYSMASRKAPALAHRYR